MPHLNGSGKLIKSAAEVAGYLGQPMGKEQLVEP
jgi:hypothetical protein